MCLWYKITINEANDHRFPSTIPEYGKREGYFKKRKEKRKKKKIKTIVSNDSPFSNIDRSFPRIATISDGKLEAQKKKRKNVIRVKREIGLVTTKISLVTTENDYSPSYAPP